MAGGKEIRDQVKSIQNTQKITKAMQMVAASKIGKSKQRMTDSRPFAKKVREVAQHLSKANPEYKHPFISSGKSPHKGLVVVSSDRGLCGGLNSNLFRALAKFSDTHDIDMRSYKVAVIGSKGTGFCRRMNMDIKAQVEGLGDNPIPDKLAATNEIVSHLFLDGEVGEIFIASNTFVSTVSQAPHIRNLLPLNMLEPTEKKDPSQLPWDYLYEPEAKVILDNLMKMYLYSIIFQAIQENICCEMAARMVAMKNATENAETLIGELKLRYNKIRQASITQEISEIVAGATAV